MTENTENKFWWLIQFHERPTKANIEHEYYFHLGGPGLNGANSRTKALEEAIKIIKEQEGQEAALHELHYDPAIERLINTDFDALKTLPTNTIFFCLYANNNYQHSPSAERRKRSPKPPKRPLKLKPFEDFPDWIKDKIITIPSGCWIWTGNITEQGYGTIRYEEERWLAHRLVYSLSTGYLDRQFLLRHECDNRMCVAPHHLIPGNVYTNTDDVIERERKDPKRFGKPILLPESLRLKDVKKIRIEHYTKDRKIRSLAREYKVGDNIIKSIVNYKIQFR